MDKLFSSSYGCVRYGSTRYRYLLLSTLLKVISVGIIFFMSAFLCAGANSDSSSIGVDIQVKHVVDAERYPYRLKAELVNTEGYENYYICEISICKYNINNKQWDNNVVYFEDNSFSYPISEFDSLMRSITSSQEEGWIDDCTPISVADTYEYQIKVIISRYRDDYATKHLNGKTDAIEVEGPKCCLMYYSLYRDSKNNDEYYSHRLYDEHPLTTLLVKDVAGKVDLLDTHYSNLQLSSNVDYGRIPTIVSTNHFSNGENYLQSDKGLLLARFSSSIKNENIKRLVLSRNSEIIDNTKTNIIEGGFSQNPYYVNIITLDQWDGQNDDGGAVYELEIETNKGTYKSSVTADRKIHHPKLVVAETEFFYGSSSEDTDESNNDTLEFKYGGIPFTARYHNMRSRIEYEPISATPELQEKTGVFPYEFTLSCYTYNNGQVEELTKDLPLSETEKGTYAFESDLMSFSQMQNLWGGNRWYTNCKIKEDGNNNFFNSAVPHVVGEGSTSINGGESSNYWGQSYRAPEMIPKEYQYYDFKRTLVYEGNDLVETIYLNIQIKYDPDNYRNSIEVNKEFPRDYGQWCFYGNDRSSKEYKLFYGTEKDYFFVEVLDADTGEEMISPMIINQDELKQENHDDYDAKYYELPIKIHYGHWYDGQVEAVLSNLKRRRIKVRARALFPFRSSVGTPEAEAMQKLRMKEGESDNITANGVVEASEPVEATYDIKETITSVGDIYATREIGINCGKGYIELKGDSGEVYSIDGKLVARGAGYYEVENGIYIVRCNGVTRKVVVK